MRVADVINPLKEKLPTTDTERFFRTEHLKTDLKGRSIRGGAVTMIAQASRFVLQMGSTAVLARLLAPEDYGLIGMVAVVIRFAQLFKDLGLSAATVQAKEINHQQVSTLFWINFALSCALTSVVAVLAPMVAWFYKEPRLTSIMLALAITFIFSGLTVQHQALLRRQMRYTSIARIEVTSMIVGVATAIVSAWYGAGYWSLVFMQLATAITNALGVWVACQWRPGWPLRGSGIRSMLAFGRNLTSFRMINYFSRNLDNILIGRYWGAQQLGLYAKAYQLVLLPIEQINVPITNIALPALSRLQTEPEQYRRYYYKAVLLITMLGMSIVSFLFASADKVITLMLGPQWLEVVPIFRFLMPAAFLGTFNIAGGWVFQSLNRTDRQLRQGLVLSTIDVLIFIVSVRWGALGVAAAYGLSRPLVWIPKMIYCYHGTPLKFTELLKTLFLPTFTSLSAAALLIVTNQLLPASPNVLIGLFRDGVIYCLFTLTTLLVIPKGKQTLFEIFKMLKEIKRR